MRADPSGRAADGATRQSRVDEASRDHPIDGDASTGHLRAADGPRDPATPRPSHRRPDPRPMRVVIGMAGIAAAAAMATAIAKPVPSITAVTTIVSRPQPAPSVLHVTRYVQLQPGETPPPQAVVQVVPTPQPKVVVVTTTRQSGKP